MSEAVAGYPATSTRPSVSVVVPAYDEEAVIAATLRTLVDYLGGLEDRYDWELVLVDDGSIDGTGEIASDVAASHRRVRVLRHPVNFGIGQALRTAFNACASDYLVVIDCDLTYGPEHIERLLDEIVSRRARIVVASPYMRGGTSTGVPWMRGCASRVANRLLGLAAAGRLRTLTGMVRAYDRRFVQALDLKAMGTEVNTEILYKAQLLRARIVEIPGHLDWAPLRGTTRRSTLRLAHGTVRSLLSVFFFRPFLFLLGPGFVAVVAAVAVLAFAVGRDFPDARAAYLVGGGLFLGALLLLATGLLALQVKRYFEELFHLGTRILRERQEDRER